jgi:hypothetical protein
MSGKLNLAGGAPEIAENFKSLYAKKFIFNNGFLYHYNGVYWAKDDKNFSILNKFIGIDYFNMLFDIYQEYDKKADKKEFKQVLTIRKNIEKLRNYSQRQNYLNEIINFITNNDRAELFLHQVFDAWQLKVWFATFHSDRNFETIRTALKARRNEANQRRKAQRNANAQGREIGDFKTETWQRERGHAKQQRRERQFRCEVHLEVQANNAKAQQT